MQLGELMTFVICLHLVKFSDEAGPLSKIQEFRLDIVTQQSNPDFYSNHNSVYILQVLVFPTGISGLLSLLCCDL